MSLENSKDIDEHLTQCEEVTQSCACCAPKMVVTDKDYYCQKQAHLPDQSLEGLAEDKIESILAFINKKHRE